MLVQMQAFNLPLRALVGYATCVCPYCAATLQVLRQHRDTLMTSAETFLHDPLVEWTPTAKNNTQGGKQAAPVLQQVRIAT